MRSWLLQGVTTSLLLIIGLPPFVVAQKLVPPIDERTDAKGNPILGGWLEMRFQQMVQSCTQTNERLTVEKKGFWGDDVREVSAIPLTVSRELNLQVPQSLLVQSDGNVIREFGYVYTKGETNTDQHNNASYLDIDYSHDAAQLTEPGISGVDYFSTCSSSMSAALQASAGYSLPIASVKAGLSSDYDQSNSYALHLVTGTFDSPVLLMYYGKVPSVSPSQSKLFADLLFWKWYKDHTDRLSSDNWILQEFKGLALYKTGGFKQQTKFDFNIQGSVTLAAASANGVADAKFENQTQILVSSFQTAAIFDSAGALHRIFFQLPTIAKLMNDIPLEASASVDVASSTLDLVDKAPKVHVQDIAGLPAEFCDPHRWQTQGAQVSIQAAVEDVKNNQQVCSFSVAYTPTDDDLTNGVVLKYNFVNTIDAADGNKYDLKIPAGATLNGSNIPRLQLAGGARFWNASNAGIGLANLTWQLVYQLIDNNRIQNSSDIDLSSVTLTCSPSVDAQPILTATITAGAPPKKLTIDATAQFQGAAPDPTNSKYSQCKLGGNVIYTLTGAANPVSKPLPDTVLYYPMHGPLAVAPAAVTPLPVGKQPQ